MSSSGQGQANRSRPALGETMLTILLIIIVLLLLFGGGWGYRRRGRV
jgi:LPXTG-motif cell wall-anchored protein